MASYIAVTCIAVFLLVGLFSFIAGGKLITAPQITIPAPPLDLHAEQVTVPVQGAPDVHGWWIKGKPGKASVLLLHGVRASRLVMTGRAKMLAERGYSVLLIDLPCHGESRGENITFGLKESTAVEACRNWIVRNNPGTNTGVIGVSLGGASVLLGKMPCGFDAVVLEAVYSNIHRAIENRLRVRIGGFAPLITPFFEAQIRFRLGVPPKDLDPESQISHLGAPVLFMGGEKDQHTLLEEVTAMYEKAAHPKSMWIVEGASHVDFYTWAPEQYESHVIPFFTQYL